MKLKRITSGLLAGALLAGCLTGCGGKDQAQTPGSSISTEKNETGDALQQTKYAYKTDVIPIATEGENGVEYVRCLAVGGNRLYYAGTVSVAGETAAEEHYESRLFCVDLETKDVRAVAFEPAPIPEGMRGNSEIRSMAVASDGSLWIMEVVDTYKLDVPEGMDPESPEAMDYYTAGETSTVLSRLDAEGKVQATIKIDLPEDFYPQKMLFDSKGNIYLGNWEGIMVFDAEGSLLMKTEMDGEEMQQIAPDRIGYPGRSKDGKMVFHLLDLEKKDWGEELPLADHAYEISAGFGPYDYLFMRNYDSIYAHNQETDTVEKLASLMECDVDVSQVDNDNICFLEDGRIVAMEEGRSEEDGFKVLILHPVERSELPQKKELTLACLDLNWNIRPLITNFNRTHDDVRIVVRDYGEDVEDQESFEDRVQTLNTEILSGNMPDLLLTSNLPLDRYASKGLILDLWPLIDADEELSREDLMEHFFDVLSVDGKLYQVTSTFSINTASTKKSIANGRESWTLKEIREELAKLQPGAGIFGETDTRDNILMISLAFDMDSFVNWKDKTCAFDSPAFTDLLEFANTFPEKFDWEHTAFEDMEGDFSRLSSGKQLMRECGISEMRDIQVENAYHQSDVAFIGLPSANGHGSAFDVGEGLAISAACKDVDAAWSFARELLLEKNQSDVGGFPTNRHAFEQKIKKEMTPRYVVNEETGKQEEVSQGSIMMGDLDVELFAATQEDYDLFMSLYEKCDAIIRVDLDIMKLIHEEAAAYFNGQKTAEEAAKLIQDRVSLYMMEQS